MIKVLGRYVCSAQFKKGGEDAILFKKREGVTKEAVADMLAAEGLGHGNFMDLTFVKKGLAADITDQGLGLCGSGDKMPAMGLVYKAFEMGGSPGGQVLTVELDDLGHIICCHHCYADIDHTIWLAMETTRSASILV